jgi:hypothetical protein
MNKKWKVWVKLIISKWKVDDKGEIFKTLKCKVDGLK